MSRRGFFPELAGEIENAVADILSRHEPEFRKRKESLDRLGYWAMTGARLGFQKFRTSGKRMSGENLLLEILNRSGRPKRKDWDNRDENPECSRTLTMPEYFPQSIDVSFNEAVALFGNFEIRSVNWRGLGVHLTKVQKAVVGSYISVAYYPIIEAD